MLFPPVLEVLTRSWHLTRRVRLKDMHGHDRVRGPGYLAPAETLYAVTTDGRTSLIRNELLPYPGMPSWHDIPADALEAVDSWDVLPESDYKYLGKADWEVRPGLEVVRVWLDDTTGWVHQVRRGEVVLFQSRSQMEAREEYPTAVWRHRVICNTNEYREGCGG